MRRYVLTNSLPNGAPFWCRNREEAFRLFRALAAVPMTTRLYTVTRGRVRLVALALDPAFKN